VRHFFNNLAAADSSRTENVRKTSSVEMRLNEPASRRFARRSRVHLGRRTPLHRLDYDFTGPQKIFEFALDSVVNEMLARIQF